MKATIQDKARAMEQANLKAAEIIRMNPARYPGFLMQEWARIYLEGGRK